jgi:hypothetical protein
VWLDLVEDVVLVGGGGAEGWGVGVRRVGARIGFVGLGLGLGGLEELVDVVTNEGVRVNEVVVGVEVGEVRAGGEDGEDVVVGGVGFGEGAEEDNGWGEVGKRGALVWVIGIFEESAGCVTDGAVERVEGFEGITWMRGGGPFFEELLLKKFVDREPPGNWELAFFWGSCGCESNCKWAVIRGGVGVMREEVVVEALLGGEEVVDGVGEVGDVGGGAELGAVCFGVGNVGAVEAGCRGASGVLVGDAEEGVLRLMDLVKAEVREELVPNLLCRIVQRAVVGCVLAVLSKVEVASGDGVDVAAEWESGCELCALVCEVVALAGGEIEVKELEGEELVGRGGEGLEEDRAYPALGVDVVADVEVALVGLVDRCDEAFAVVGAVVIEEDVVWEGVLEGVVVVGVEVGFLYGDDVVGGGDGFDVVDDVAVAWASSGGGVVGGERINVVGAEGGSGDEGEGVVERRRVVVGVEWEGIGVNGGVVVDVVVVAEAGVGEVDGIGGVAVVVAAGAAVGRRRGGVGVGGVVVGLG